MRDSKILVVEDHPTSRKLLMAMLRKDYTVEGAPDGDEALKLAAELKPDLVLLDVELPGMDGFATLARLREGVIDTTVPVLFLTARDDCDSRDKGLQAGAVDYLTKPYDRHELSIKVKNHLDLYHARREIESRNRIMAQELEMASQLQHSLLPQRFPKDDRISLAVAYIPTSSAGGDFYDVTEMDEALIGFVQVDVSGHGIRSAMIGAMFKMAFQMFAKEHRTPAELITRLNDQMVEVIPDSDFLTVFYGAIDVSSMRLTYTNAGHTRPFLFRAGANEVCELGQGGMIVGAFPSMDYEEGCETLGPGDKILLYTDGVTEAGNTRDVTATFGDERLKRLFLENVHRSGEEIVDLIVKDLREFQCGESLEDDISLLLVSIH